MNRRKDGRWQVKKTLNGKAVFFYSTAKTERKAKTDIENQMLKFAETSHKNAHNFKEIADRMIEYRSQTIENQTINTYVFALKRASDLDNMEIEEIKPSDVQAVLNNLARQGYSFSAVSKTKVAIGLVFDYAIVHEDLPLNNFMRSIRVPKNLPKPNVSTPTDEIIVKVIKNAYTADFGLWAVSLLFTGCRCGELNALQVKDINFNEKTISISKSTEFPNNQPVIKTPKTQYSIGLVPIFDLYEPFLKEIIKNKSDTDYLFGGQFPLSKTAIYKRWKKYCKEIGEDFTEHQLRHAYALLLYRASVPPKQAQKYLRHSSFQITMDIYTAFDNEFSKSKTAGINDYLNNFYR